MCPGLSLALPGTLLPTGPAAPPQGQLMEMQDPGPTPAQLSQRGNKTPGDWGAGSSWGRVHTAFPFLESLSQAPRPSFTLSPPPALHICMCCSEGGPHSSVPSCRHLSPPYLPGRLLPSMEGKPFEGRAPSSSADPTASTAVAIAGCARSECVLCGVVYSEG